MMFEEQFIEVDAIIPGTEDTLRVCINKAHIVSIDEPDDAGCEIFLTHSATMEGDVVTKESYNSILHRLQLNIFKKES